MKREPVLTAAVIVAIVMAALQWLIVMGYLSWTPEQVTATEQLVTTLAPFLLIIVGAVWARSKVTPVSDPRDNAGNSLVPEK